MDAKKTEREREEIQRCSYSYSMHLKSSEKSSSSIEYAISTCAVSIQGIASFVTLAEAAGICIAVSEKILRRAEDADYDRIVERLSQKSSARGVIMFADEDETRFVTSTNTQISF